jgi:hypothetical protein
MGYHSKSNRSFERHILKYALMAIGVLAIIILIYMINTMPTAN